MKIRTGFVSNSSSTSFCICGFIEETPLDSDILAKIEKYNEQCLGVDPQIQIYKDPTYEEAEQYIGIDIENMEAFETRREFEDKCKNILIRIFPHLSITGVYFHHNGWYAG